MKEKCNAGKFMQLVEISSTLLHKMFVILCINIGDSWSWK